jgi:hypothetical protein
MRTYFCPQSTCSGDTGPFAASTPDLVFEPPQIDAVDEKAKSPANSLEASISDVPDAFGADPCQIV